MSIKASYIGNVLIGLTSLLLVNACTPKESINDKKTRMASEHKLIIGTSDPVTFFAPPYTRLDAKINEAEIYPASQRNLHDSLDGVEDALAIYPKNFVSSQIDAIFIAGKMYFGGMPAGGAYHNSWIIVASTTAPMGESNYEAALYGVHHELSSYVFHKSTIVGMIWGELMPKDWRTKMGYKDVLAANDEPIDYQNGFLSPYAKTTLENDFNTYAEFVFARQNELIELAKKYPLVAKKLRLFIIAYTKQFPDMEQFFKKSALNKVATPDDKLVLTLPFHIDVSSIKPTIIYPKEQ